MLKHEEQLSLILQECFGISNNITQFQIDNTDFVLFRVGNRTAGFTFIEHLKTSKKKQKKYYIHTVCIGEKFRGKGLCAPFLDMTVKKYEGPGVKFKLEVTKVGFVESAIIMIKNLKLYYLI